MRQLFPVADDADPFDAYGRLIRLGPRRRGVRLNTIASVDGAAALQRRSGALGGPADKAVFAVLRTLADVTLVGAGTIRAPAPPPRLGLAHLLEADGSLFLRYRRQ